MDKRRWNDNWTVCKGFVDIFSEINGNQPEGKKVNLPFDPMIEEKRDPSLENGTQSGYYPAHTYTFTKEFTAPKDWEGGIQLLEFEGVMKQAMVYLNGEFLGGNDYGYGQFFVDMTPHMKYGMENIIKVISRNNDHGSRWYPGCGIYRDVNLYTSGTERIIPETLRLRTEYVEEGYALISAEAEVESRQLSSRKATVSIRFISPDGSASCGGVNTISLGGSHRKVKVQMHFTVPDAALWSPDSPNLYRCIVSLNEGETCLDKEECEFGIRTLRLDARKGLRINGVETKLRGACIHHDNGLIGAATLPDAEYYRAEKMKEAGINALRSAHHPMSPAMLNACDHLGILVMDELCDIWNTPKSPSDYSYDFAGNYEKDIANMVAKDYNHPCVILYSMGNEIPEIGLEDGGEYSRRIAAEFRRLDSGRYVTAAMNGFQAISEFLISAGKKAHESGKTGIEAMNEIMGGSEGDFITTLSLCDLLGEKLEEPSCAADVAGYNYLTARHELEHTLHPDRVVMGSETFPPEIPQLWKIVERNHSVIGDFTWTGYDYVGEAGIGIPHYNCSNSYPDRLAYCGDINLNGYRRPVSYLREIAYGLRKEPFIAVDRPEYFGRAFDRNSWKYDDCIDSWTWHGFEGKRVVVRVLADCDEVELLLNGNSLGKKDVKDLTAVFTTTYQPGTLTAIARTNNEITGQTTLETAGKVCGMCISPNKFQIKADGEGAACITCDLVDETGRMNMQEQRTVSVRVEGPGYLAGFGSACPSCEGTYQDNSWKTFDGRVMAVVRSGYEQGHIIVTFTVEGLDEKSVSIECMVSCKKKCRNE